MVNLPKKQPQLAPEVAKKLRKLLENTGYEIRHVNGQRVFAPSQSVIIPPPIKGTEVFVGNLPPNMYEDELVKLFSSAGPIYMLRIMLDFGGNSRGFAFITYFDIEAAHEAVRIFDQSIVRSRTKIAVSISLDNRRLFFGNIPKNRSKAEFMEVLQQYVEGIKEIIMYQEPLNRKLNRGFLFLEFESHRFAAIARRQLTPANLILWGKTIFIDWAEPLPVIKPEIVRELKKLYLRNIPVHLSTDHLRRVLQDVLGPVYYDIKKVHKMCDFAFVHFSRREHCISAFKTLQDLEIGGEKVRVEWARPIEYSKRYRSSNFELTCCKSIPANLKKANRGYKTTPNSSSTYSSDSCNPDPVQSSQGQFI